MSKKILVLGAAPALLNILAKATNAQLVVIAPVNTGGFADVRNPLDIPINIIEPTDKSYPDLNQLKSKADELVKTRSKVTANLVTKPKKHR